MTWIEQKMRLRKSKYFTSGYALCKGVRFVVMCLSSPLWRFLDKTRNHWSDRENFAKQEGKYDLLRMDYTTKVNIL